MERETLQRITSTAPISGSLIGLMWIVSFVGVANAATSPLFSLFGLGLGVGSLFAVSYMGYQFRWRACNGNLPFSGQWLLSAMILFYACILMATGMVMYMKFLDEGRFAQMYLDMMEMPEQKALMESMLADTGVTLDEVVSGIVNAKPINFALQATQSNLLLSFMVSPILALAARIRTPKRTN